MSKAPLSIDELGTLLRDQKLDLFALDGAVWSHLRKIEWPLTHYDTETFLECRREGAPSARAVSEPTAILRFLEDEHTSVRMKIETGERIAAVSIFIGGYSIGVGGEFRGEFSFSELGRAVAAAGVAAHHKACSLRNRLSAVVGITVDRETMKTWPIEELEPGVFYPVNHDLGLASHGARTEEKAREMIEMNHKGPHGLMLCHERYEKIMSLRSDLSDSPSI